jgi:hypothetical protein
MDERFQLMLSVGTFHPLALVFIARGVRMHTDDFDVFCQH